MKIQSLVREGRMRAAAKEISGRRALHGLGCACGSRPVIRSQKLSGPRLRGYERVLLHGVSLRGRGLGAVGPSDAGTPALIPVSDRSAVMAAIKRFAAARGK